MQRPADVDAKTWLRQCVNWAQALPMAEALKANYLADLAILSGLVYKSETIMTIISPVAYMRSMWSSYWPFTLNRKDMPCVAYSF